MKNSFFSRFTPKEPKFFPLLKQLSEILVASSELLVESLKHDSPEERAGYYKQIKDCLLYTSYPGKIDDEPPCFEFLYHFPQHSYCRGDPEEYH